MNVNHLNPGDELAIDYNGSNGRRTITTYVALVEKVDHRRNRHRVVVAEPGARRPRFLSVEVETATCGTVENTWLLRSHNSKSDRGRRLGRVLNAEPTGEHDDAYESVAHVFDAVEGDVVLVDDDLFVVTAKHNYSRTGHRINVENLETGESFGITTSPTGVDVRGVDVEGDVRVDLTTRTLENENAVAVWNEIMDDRDVESIEIDGRTFTIKYRYKADVEGLRLIADDATEDDLTLEGVSHFLFLDPLGFKLRAGFDSATRIDADDVELVHTLFN